MDDERSTVPLTPAGEALRHGWWRGRSDEDFEASLGDLFFEGDDLKGKLWRFGSLIVLSAAIAGFGLLADSAGVVIGAMLVAPLMTPIQALGAALVQGSTRRMLTSAVVILGGFIGAVITGYVVAVIGAGGISVEALPQEILSRTAAGLSDLGITVAAGAAGGYVIARPAVSGALPGVVSPSPSCRPWRRSASACSSAKKDLARGALLLFATNLAAIVLSGAVMIAGAGFRPRQAHGTGLRRGSVSSPPWCWLSTSRFPWRFTREARLPIRRRIESLMMRSRIGIRSSAWSRSRSTRPVTPSTLISSSPVPATPSACGSWLGSAIGLASRCKSSFGATRMGGSCCRRLRLVDSDVATVYSSAWPRLSS